MLNNGGSLVFLPKKGLALIITDLHGNLEDFKKYMGIWNDINSKNDHLILTGDFIHGMGQKDDNSIEIVEYLIRNFSNDQKVHLLLGNHEWSIISKVIIYKSGKNLNQYFQEMLKRKFGSGWEDKLDYYINFFKKLSLGVKTENKVFISHSGPPKIAVNLNDMINLKNEGYLNNSILYDLLWNRYGDYNKKDLANFLKSMNCNAMIVGHTPVNGVKLINKRQLIVSSSFSNGKKAYVELDLEEEINNGKDLLKMVRYLK